MAITRPLASSRGQAGAIDLIARPVRLIAELIRYLADQCPRRHAQFWSAFQSSGDSRNPETREPRNHLQCRPAVGSRRLSSGGFVLDCATLFSGQFASSLGKGLSSCRSYEFPVKSVSPVVERPPIRQGCYLA
jgi:hypothetical protein